MVRSCYVPLALWGGLWALYGWLLSSIADLSTCFLVGGFTGLMTLGFLNAVIEGWNTWRYRRAISRASRQEPLVDGRLVAVIGEAQPVDEPAVAPFSGTACILCEYSIKRPGNESDSSSTRRPHFGVDVSGYVMNPCLIRSGQGDVRLIGFPQTDGFDCGYPALPSHVRAARELVEAGEFDVVGMRIGSLIRGLNATFVDDDGYVRRKFQLRPEAGSLFSGLHAYERQSDDVVRRIFDILDDEDLDDEELDDEDSHDRQRENESRLGESPADDGADDGVDDERDDAKSEPDAPRDNVSDTAVAKFVELRAKLPELAETIVPVGATVCAVGVYSAEQRALVPRATWRAEFTRLYAGDVADVEARLRTSSRQKCLGGLFALLVVHAILITALILGARAKAGDKQASASGGAGGPFAAHDIGDA